MLKGSKREELTLNHCASTILQHLTSNISPSDGLIPTKQHNLALPAARHGSSSDKKKNFETFFPKRTSYTNTAAVINRSPTKQAVTCYLRG